MKTKSTARRLDESRTRTNKIIEQHELRSGYLEVALDESRLLRQTAEQDVRDVRKGIRTLRFLAALLITGWGLSVGVLLAALR